MDLEYIFYITSNHNRKSYISKSSTKEAQKNEFETVKQVKFKLKIPVISIDYLLVYTLHNHYQRKYPITSHLGN